MTKITNGDYIVRVRGYLPCRIVSRVAHNCKVQVQFEDGARRWFTTDKVKGAEIL